MHLTYAAMTALPASPPQPTTAATPHQPPTPTNNINKRPVILIRSLDGSRCFIHPGQVSRAVCGSIFQKKIVGDTLAITGGGRGIKFEVANLDHLDQPPETVTRLGDWPVKCWVATDDDPTYNFGRIFPVTSDLTEDTIARELSVLDGCPTSLVSVFRLPSYTKDGKTVPNLAVRLKFRGPIPPRVALDGAVYRVRAHTLPVLRCTRCLMFGHGNISCNGKARCRKCSGFHATDGCSRTDHCLFCGLGHPPTSRQCPAYLRAVAIQELQHKPDHSILDVKRKLRGILPGQYKTHTPTVQVPASRSQGSQRPPAPPHVQVPTPPHPTVTLAPLMQQPLTPPPHSTPITPSRRPAGQTPKPQRPRRSPNRHPTTPQRRATRPAFIPEGPYRDNSFIPPTPIAPQPPCPVPAPSPRPQPPASPSAAQRPLPSLGSAGLAPPPSSLPAQHASGFAWPAFVRGIAPIVVDFFQHLMSGNSLGDCLLRCLPGLLSFLTSLSQ